MRQELARVHLTCLAETLPIKRVVNVDDEIACGELHGILLSRRNAWYPGKLTLLLSTQSLRVSNPMWAAIRWEGTCVIKRLGYASQGKRLGGRQRRYCSMTLTLQTPGTGETLHNALIEAAAGATGGYAAFAFATSTGIDTALAEPPVRELVGTGSFRLIVGLDAITDTKAIAAINTVKTSLPNADISLFYNPKGGLLYHPKTMFFKRPSGGCCLTGSGNLTLGGLKYNWEAFWRADLSTADATVVERHWTDWLDAHRDNLLPPHDPRVTEQAALNARTRAAISTAVSETDQEALAALGEEVADAASLNPFLIAEVPKNRPGQADFGISAYQGFFGVTLGTPRQVTFYQVMPDGALAEPEHRQAVAVKSSNYRFEVDAMRGLQFPNAGHFILMFERIGRSEYKYVFLKPGEPGHASVQKFLDQNYFSDGVRKRRIVVTRGDVAAAWPKNPLLLH